MMGFKQALRLLNINWVLVKHGLDEVVFATHLFRPVRFLLYFWPPHWFRQDNATRGERIRRALEELGPLFVKFGQLLSTRRDLLADDIADELAKLQDRVPPFPGLQARQLIEAAYKQDIHAVFAEFDETPLASASIAQVHAARLLDGSEVVVKVVRPGIKRVIERDVSLLYIVAGLAERYWPQGRRLRPLEVVREYEKTILDELDLMREAGNASQLRRNFIDSPLLYIPGIYWPHCRRGVMVMERISGIPVSNVDVLRRRGVDFKLLAERGVEIFFTQVFKHNFFHADMHPGNIFVSPEGKYLAVDFGIMGSLSAEDQRYLAGNFVAFFNRDYRRVAELHVESGWVPKGTRIDEMEAAIRTVCEPIFERPLKDISLGHLLMRLFQAARRFNMEVQPQLVLLQKTLLNVEGLGRQLYPELDLWQTAKPFLERWMSEQLGSRALLKNLKANLPLWAETLPRLPTLLHDLAKRAEEGELELQWRSDEIAKLRREVRSANRRSFAAISAAALIVSAAVILGLDGYAPRMLADAPLISWVLGGIALAILISYWPSGTQRD
ncbi:ubiquinone biosynthesis protein UbiB [Candidatus Tenderia electrophaga]|jgi:ubiquinone biosynthesis protein|uniref:Probable protein kinase UbiB n=1 Tax=Candidatus Tenderia electrophaga TaxID=1748243 RepID=A0A0S2THB5_9GAMM|nr:ubiquinone biosynthesis protein UbiB [Candidatus Tenderia electrophaga]